MRFCGACGERLRDAPLPVEAGERRPVTVLFADLVGSSALAARLDPEDFRALLLGFRKTAADVIARHRGSLAQHQGDGLLARFGFPIAREDDAHRALRAGLELVAAVAGDAAAEGLRLRVALHSGIAVVATLGHGAAAEPGAMVGETTTIAARLQTAARPGEVWASEATRRLAGPRFRFTPMGDIALAGLPRPVAAHRLEGEAAEAGATTTLPLVGRDRELRSLFAAWRDAEAGAGSALLIEAEPGMGKSRLVAEFRARLGQAAEGAVMIAAGSQDGESAFRPLLGWLAGAIGPGGRGALAGWMERVGLAAEHAAPLAVLLGCASPAEVQEMAQAGRRRRRRNLAALLAGLRAGAAGPVCLFVAEDIHWADDSSLTLLRQLADACAAPGARMLLLLTRRAEGRALPGAAPMTLRLPPLTPEEGMALAIAAAPNELTPAMARQIVERAGGVPMFVAEAARDMEAGAALPLTLRAALTSRLDALTETKSVAQLAAVLGRSFPVALIEALAEAVGAPPPRRALRLLAEAGFLEPEGPAEAPTGFVFRHELMRDTAYETLLRSRRTALHRAVATLMQARPGTRPEQLGWHLAAGGDAVGAIAAYDRAAHAAAEASAHVEAAAHGRAALALLPGLADGPQRWAAEARLNIALAAQVTITRGNAADEVGEAFSRAHQAAQRLGDARVLLRTLRGLQTYHLVRGNVAEGHAFGQAVLDRLAEETDPALLLQAHRAFGLGLIYLGRAAEARHHLTRALALYDTERDAPHRVDYGSDPQVLAYAHLGWALWFDGEPAAALAADAEALRAARALSHPHSLCFALAFSTALAQFADRPGPALAAAQELQALAAQQEFPYWAAWGAILEGWARARLGDAVQGEAVLRRGLDDYAATGAGLLRPYGLALLAAILPPTRGAEAAALVAEARSLAEAGSIRFAEAAIRAA